MTQQHHIDPATLEMLLEVLEDGFPTLVETFISDSQLRIDDIKAGLEANHAEAVRRSAHSLKGSSSNLGAVVLAELSQRLELAAQGGDLQDVPGIIERIEVEFFAVKDTLSPWLSTAS